MICNSSSFHLFVPRKGSQSMDLGKIHRLAIPGYLGTVCGGRVPMDGKYVAPANLFECSNVFFMIKLNDCKKNWLATIIFAPPRALPTSAAGP